VTACGQGRRRSRHIRWHKAPPCASERSSDGRATLAWQAEACPTHATQPPGNGQKLAPLRSRAACYDLALGHVATTLRGKPGHVEGSAPTGAALQEAIPRDRPCWPFWEWAPTCSNRLIYRAAINRCRRVVRGSRGGESRALRLRPPKRKPTISAISNWSASKRRNCRIAPTSSRRAPASRPSAPCCGRSDCSSPSLWWATSSRWPQTSRVRAWPAPSRRT